MAGYGSWENWGGMRADPYQSWYGSKGKGKGEAPPSVYGSNIGGSGKGMVGKGMGSQTPCKFFSTTGYCRNGDACGFSHDGAGGDMGGGFDAMPGQKSGEPCKFFARSGWCQWGDECKHEHVGGEGGVSMGTMPVKGKGKSIGVPLGGATASQKSGEECQHFARTGWCKYATQCRHEHVGEFGGMPAWGGSVGMPVGEVGREKSGEACGFFLKSGWCKYGEACRHEHVAGPETPISLGPPPSGE
ncbi:unnamed protein product, partial [Polarella glacialis]